MRRVKIGCASVSVKVCDFQGNAARLRQAIEAAKDENVHLLVTPELGLSGYSLEDRIFWPSVARRSWDALEGLAEACGGINAFIGLPVFVDGMTYNGAAFIANKKICGVVLKKYLPTYSIFYEGRNWTAWPGGVSEVNGVPAGDLVFELPFGGVSAEICEDLWASTTPARARVLAGAEIICNPSASPFVPRKNEERKRLVLGTASRLKCVYAYANLLGCDSSRLVFDGGGLVVTPEEVISEGELLSKRNWTLCTGVVDLEELARVRTENTTWRQSLQGGAEARETPVIPVDDTPYAPASLKEFTAHFPPDFYAATPQERKADRDPWLDELFDALVLGLRDYFEKVGVLNRFLVALSGGRDSALCLLLAVEAAKALNEGKEAARYGERVSTLYMPNKGYSSPSTARAAQELAEELGVPFKEVSISEEASVAKKIAAEVMGDPDRVTDIAHQNLQARIRGAIMLNWANSAKGLVLVTSNLSEMAVGYSTTGGDNQGGYSPIANVPKTLASKLLAYLAERDGIQSLKNILAIPPSAELEEGQEDERDLMPYAVLDDLLHLYARRRFSLANSWRILCHRHPEHDPERLREWTADFARRFVSNQWKRDQHPVALKVMGLDLDPKTGFRFPVTQSIDHELDELQQAKQEA